jgi:hypothetical protein
MKSNSAGRVRVAQTLLPISNSSAGSEHSDIRCDSTGALASFLRLAAVIVLMMLACGPAFAQRESTGYPEDWTHHHLVLSDPGTLHEASARGAFNTWYKVVTDPRFIFQQRKRAPFPRRGKGNVPPPDPLGRDWSATLGGAGVAPGVFPAKWQFSVTSTPSCSDYVVFPVNTAGVSGSQPNLVAYQNLYVNAVGTGVCPGTAPTVLFSYFVGAGTVQTSPVLGGSVDEVAFVESITGGSKFHVLKGAGSGASNGTVAIPVAPGAGNGATDVAITLSGGVSVTRSSPFYSYGNDTAYVGDDSGVLHKFTPVFNGTPAEVTTGGWPATVSTQTGKILTGPVHDGLTDMVFVGDSHGYLYSVSPTGTVTQSGQLAAGTGIVEPPMVDSYGKSVYVIVGDNAVGTASAVYVFNISTGNNFSSGSTGSSVAVGTSSTTVPLFGGAFDNAYLTSANAAQPAGNLYVCGNAGGNPTLYQIPITYSSGPVLGTVATGPVLAGGNVGCSPVTEFYNSSTSTDWLFAGVPGTSCGAGTGAGGCVMSFNVTSGAVPSIGPWAPSTSYASNSEVVDTSGRLQKCTGGGCGTTSLSGASTPTWTGTTTSDGTTTNATSTGTVSANSAVGGATVTIGTLTLTASAPTKASSPILINTEPGNGNTITINGTVYDWHGAVGGCAASPQKCVRRNLSTTTSATNLVNAINGTCFTGACGVDPTVTATSTTNTVTITAITPGTSANSDVLATNNSNAIRINGARNASTFLGTSTGIAGTDGSNTAPSFQYWSGASAVSAAALAANIAGAITVAEQTSAGISLSYTAGNTFLTITGAGANAGVAGNSVPVGGTLTGFAWSPTGHLAGGSTALTWTSQGAGNGQTTAPEATGTSAIIIDNVGTGAGEASIYFGTLSGTGATNSAVKMTQAGLQ